MMFGDQINRQKSLRPNSHECPIYCEHVISLVSYKMHKARRDVVTACVKSLLNGSAATVTSIGRGISTKAFEKHRIKRADRLLSNSHLLSETPLIYASICQLFCSSTSRPVISIDWSD